MARLIDADALLEEHCGACSLQQREMCKNDPVCGSAMWIIEAPTVDAVEVVHGWWIKHPDDLFPAESMQECSVCHEQEFFTLLNENYCPNCGAKMDGDGNG